MANSKNRRKTLLSSVIMLIMCLAMFAGSTFAWFTDAVVSNKNVIMAGGFDLSVYWSDTLLDSDSTEWKNVEDEENNAIFTGNKWEPGFTEVKYIKIVNEGSLSFKWKMNVVTLGEISALGDVIDVYYVVNPEQAVTRQQLLDSTPAGVLSDVLADRISTNGVLLSPDESKDGFYSGEIIVAIAMKMQEEAGNEYMWSSIGTSFSIQLLATQYSIEEDSFDEKYDENAQYPVLPDTWDGTADTSWYFENSTATSFDLDSAEAVAGFAALVNGTAAIPAGVDVTLPVTFEGQTLNLTTDVDLAGVQWTSIGSAYNNAEWFAGTFDGQGNTVYNMNQSKMSGASGEIGFFGYVGDATVKNLNIDGAYIMGYGPYAGIVAARAYGDCTFENITLTNNMSSSYNTGNGGIVGLVYGNSNYTFKDITIDETNTLEGLWGSYDCAVGGVIGWVWFNNNTTPSPIKMENVNVAAKIDVFNDVCSNYQWGAYRYSGMLIGYADSTVEVDGRTYANASTLECSNVTVTYGDWVNYTYCESESYGRPSYASEGQWKYQRVQANESYGGIKEAHEHDTDESHEELFAFDQLLGGGQGVYGNPTFEGVTVIYN